MTAVGTMRAFATGQGCSRLPGVAIASQGIKPLSQANQRFRRHE